MFQNFFQKDCSVDEPINFSFKKLGLVVRSRKVEQVKLEIVNWSQRNHLLTTSSIPLLAEKAA